MTQQDRDAVKVGEIRLILIERLERQIEELGRLIRKGYHGRHVAEKYLAENIGGTLTEIDNLNTFAGLPLLRRSG